ncbi:hypothetical protein MG293_006282 [Ovis ammon polii]|uniref:Uncharacterized protein n=1 Tax=Ovis ammon polii TaxID=230172 RepID=A0AAD4UCC3_OVIAM|nr:hypothetical protein MG293_006282 [Ovis ammon polii]
MSSCPSVFPGVASRTSCRYQTPGGCSSSLYKMVTFPIDLTKTQLQIQGQKNDANFKEIRYEGMLHALVRMGREKAMLHQASYGTIKIRHLSELEAVIFISLSIANPTDTGNFINIYQQEGKRGLWKRVSLTTQRAAIVGVVELLVYDLTKKHLILSDLMGDTMYTHFLSGFTCGLAGALASNPVNVVRTCTMNQKGFALYKRFWLNWLGVGPWNLIFFVTYEQLKKLDL